MLRLTQMQSQRNSLAEQLEMLQTNLYQLQTALGNIEPLYREILNSPLEPELMADERKTVDSGAQVISINRLRQSGQGN